MNSAKFDCDRSPQTWSRTTFRNTLTIAATWSIVTLVVAVTLFLGARYARHAPKSHKRQLPMTTRAIVHPVPWAQIDAEVSGILKTARDHAQDAANTEVGAWIRSLDPDINAFLDWYFAYFTQQQLALKSVWWDLSHKLDPSCPSFPDRLRSKVQEEFASRVMRPELAQARMESIARSVTESYVEEIQTAIARLPDRYDIPRPMWERYIADVGALAAEVNGNRDTALAFKVATCAIGGITAYSAGKLVGRLPRKLPEGVVTRSGSGIVASLGGRLLGITALAGVVTWDLADHYRTVRTNRPLLRRAVSNYLEEVRGNLVHDPEEGVLSAVYNIERAIQHSSEAQHRSQ